MARQMIVILIKGSTTVRAPWHLQHFILFTHTCHYLPIRMSLIMRGRLYSSCVHWFSTGLRMTNYKQPKKENTLLLTANSDIIIQLGWPHKTEVSFIYPRHSKTDSQVLESLRQQCFSPSLCRRLDSTLRKRLSHFPVHRTRLDTPRNRFFSQAADSVSQCHYTRLCKGLHQNGYENRLYQRQSSQPVSQHGTEENKANVTKADMNQ